MEARTATLSPSSRPLESSSRSSTLSLGWHRAQPASVSKVLQVSMLLFPDASCYSAETLTNSTRSSLVRTRTLLGSTAATNGIVIATEKKSSSILMDSSMIDKVCTICPNIGIVYSGMGPDYRVSLKLCYYLTRAAYLFQGWLVGRVLSCGSAF